MFAFMARNWGNCNLTSPAFLRPSCMYRNIQRKSHAGKKGKSGSDHGQKGKWSLADDGSMHAATSPDPGDPSYDPEEDENQRYILVSDSTEMEGLVDGEPLPGLSLPEFKAQLKSILEEYFVSAQLEEACCSIQELDSPNYHYEVVKRAVNMSLDRNVSSAVRQSSFNFWTLVSFSYMP